MFCIRHLLKALILCFFFYDIHVQYRVCARRPCWRTKTIEDVCVKIKIYLSKENHCAVSVLQHGRRAHTLYVIALVLVNNVSQSQIKWTDNAMADGLLIF